MSNYQNYLPEDLAADDSFRRWVLFNSHEDRLFWEEWIESNSDKRKIIENAKKYLIWTYEAFDDISDEEISEEIYRLSQRIELEEDIKKIDPSGTPFWLKIAASIFLILGIGWWINKTEYLSETASKEIISNTEVPLKEVINETDKPMFVGLADGSNIILYPDSKVTYPSSFKGEKREVFLSGEAFFEVSKNAEKPFFVYSNLLTTKVLGTSFNIKAYENQGDIKVTVKTGKVSVYPLTKDSITSANSSNKLDGMVLVPNEQIVFVKKNQKLMRSLIENKHELELPIQSQQFAFKAAKIDDVFEVLEKSYGVKILYDKEVMKSCYLTADLSDEPLYEKINLICKTIGAEYSQIKGQIQISSRGCYE